MLGEHRLDDGARSPDVGHDVDAPHGVPELVGRLGPALAERIAAELAAETTVPAVNLTTGEVLDEGDPT